MSLLALRSAVVAGLAASLGAVPVQAYGGRVDEAELKRMAAQAPSVWVAVVAAPEAEQTSGGEYDVEALLVAFLITRSKPGSPRDAAALLLVDGVLQTVPGNDWGLEKASRPAAIRADNLYSGELDKQGLAIWAVTWRQELRMGGLDPATLVDFKTYHADWAVGATPDTPKPADELKDLHL